MNKRPRKLTEDQVRAIRDSYEPGAVLAGRYGVCQSLISRTRTGAKYPEIEGPVQHPRAMRKLTEADVRAIRASRESRKVLAARYGVTRDNIGKVRGGRAWVHIPMDRAHVPVGHKLTGSAVLAIRASQEPAPALASRFGVSRQTIRDVRQGRTWRSIASTQQELH